MPATAVLIKTPTFLEARPAPATDVLFRDVIHDLRQPLSSIEAIAYYLEMTLPAEQGDARQYMRRLQELVDQADSILQRAAAGIVRA